MYQKIFSRGVGKKEFSLCEDFSQIAMRTWLLLKNADKASFSIGEETITDINLLELQMRKPGIINVKKLSRMDESKIGADWIWIIIGKTGRTFILYVQAKKLFTKTSRYENLYKAAEPLEQVNKLISNSFTYSPLGVKIYPIYVFYNYLDSPKKNIECNCGNSLNIEFAGCSYADAIEVREKILKKENTFIELADIQYAWSCLVCCKGRSTLLDSFEYDLAAKFFSQIVNRDRLNNLMLNQNKPNFNSENLISDTTPDFVTAIMESNYLAVDMFQDLEVGSVVILKEN